MAESAWASGGRSGPSWLAARGALLTLCDLGGFCTRGNRVHALGGLWAVVGEGEEGMLSSR